MHKIFFCKNVAKVHVEDLRGDTIVVYHKLYNPPKVNGAQYLTFDKFKCVYMNLHFENMVVVGLNRIITPANRCNMVNDYMQTMTRSKNKISIDTSPFIGEPWRLWYHFDITNSSGFNVPHGYAMETEWKKWFFRDIDYCRLSGQEIHKYYDSNIVFSDLKKINFNYKLTDVSKKDKEWYDEAKEHVISSNSSSKKILLDLLRLCNTKFKTGLSFETYSTVKGLPIYVPNVGIYRFVIEENIRRTDIYNAVIRNA